MSLAWLVALAALAHPGGRRIATHHVAAHVDDDRIAIDYRLQVPRPRHLHDGLPPPPPEQVLPGVAELQVGFRVVVDGETVPLEPEGEPSFRGSDTMTEVRVRFVGRLDDAHGRVTVENGNFPDLPGFYAASWTVGPTLDVTGSSLFEWRGGALDRDHDGDWQIGEEYRASWIEVQPRPPLDRWWVGPVAEVRPIGQAFPATLADRAYRPGLVLGGVVLAVGVGFAWRRRRT